MEKKILQKAFNIKISGIVQGVGFRPFIYRLAKEYDICGYVSNTTFGVFIHAESSLENLKKFTKSIEKEKPNISEVYSIETELTDIEGYETFQIKKSSKENNNKIYIAPDFSTCKNCKLDILDMNNRRYMYSFTTCTYCGPRYSIITDIPYDRDKTVMNEFKMCDECQKEYENPLDRRYHSQPNACNTCGPQLMVYDTGHKKEIREEDPVDFISRELKKGSIIAIKGLGGYLLCCDAKNNETVEELRIRKHREAKPFAIMCRDTETAGVYVNLSEEEKELLECPQNPIVLLTKKSESKLAESISMDNNYLGIMLPYTPLHILIMESIDVLVMTSANISDIPIISEDSEAIDKLGSIADYILLHNRKIKNRVDDSVFRIINKKPQALRRGRGYVPGIIKTEGLKKTVLAVGPELKNTFAINRENTVFTGPHIGDLKNRETYNFFKNSIEEFQYLLGLKPDIVACDLHPDYMSTKYAKEKHSNVVEVQHHHAHMVSAMTEYDLNEDIIGISMDGTGLGYDNTIWGCECGIVNRKEFKRLGHLDTFMLPGGDKCVKEVYRSALSLIYSTFGNDNYYKPEFLKTIHEIDIKNLMVMMDKEINTYKTSSMGRLFDGVSAFIGLGNYSNYDASQAIILESIAVKGIEDSYTVKLIYKDNKHLLDYRTLIEEIAGDLVNNVSKPVISTKFHNYVVDYIYKMCKTISRDTGIKKIVLSGGVFLNSIISTKSETMLKENGFIPFLQRKFPPNDGSISIGQLIIANEVTK
jgi:hydrogenase maturation protein HypF